jgi:hypothetical protein
MATWPGFREEKADTAHIGFTPVARKQSPDEFGSNEDERKSSPPI